MFAIDTAYRPARTPFRIAAVAQAVERVRATMKRLEILIGRRRAASAARWDLGAMSERELRDIGLVRIDAHPTLGATAIEVRNGGCGRFHAGH